MLYANTRGDKPDLNRRSMEYKNLFFLTVARKYGQLIFIIKTTLCFSMLSLAAWFVFILPFPAYIAPQFILGALYAHMIELQHESLHGATQWKWLNRILGFLFGIPMLISYSDYQYHHMLHHEHVGTDKDTEYFNYSSQKTLSLFKFIKSMFMFEHYARVYKKLFNAVFLNKLNIVQPNIRKRITQEYKLFLLIITGVICLSITQQSLLIFKLWIMPLVLFAAPIHFLIEFPEHVFCDNTNTNIFANTRTIKSNWLMSWFVNGNNFHVAHHYAPNYPISILADINKEIGGKALFYEKSYTEFYKHVFKKFTKSVSDK